MEVPRNIGKGEDVIILRIEMMTVSQFSHMEKLKVGAVLLDGGMEMEEDFYSHFSQRSYSPPFYFPFASCLSFRSLPRLS